MAQALAIWKNIPKRICSSQVNNVVVLGAARVNLPSFLVKRPVFQTVDATHLAHPVVPLAHGLADALRVVWHSKDFAFLSERRA